MDTGSDPCLLRVTGGLIIGHPLISLAYGFDICAQEVSLAAMVTVARLEEAQRGGRYMK